MKDSSFVERFFRGISLKEDKEDRDGEEEKGQEEEVGEKNDEGMDKKEE